MKPSHINYVLFLIGCTLLFTVSCSRLPNLLHIEGFAQGTTYHITFYANKPLNQSLIEEEITNELKRIDKSISNYRPDSDIEIFNATQSDEPQTISAEIITLVEIARRVRTASGGCYDLTIKPLFDLWGFKKNVFHLPSDQQLKDTLALIGMDKLETVDATHLRKKNSQLRVDLSSIGQGYSVGKIAQLLEQHDITNYIVEIGGELITRGKKPDGSPWRIALEKPLNNQREIEKIAVFNSGEATAFMPSGTYHHYFEHNGKRYSHILDARDGKPIEHHTVSVSVFASNPALADAWSTALLCLGSEQGKKVAEDNKIAALFIDEVNKEFVEFPTTALTHSTSLHLENSKKR